MNVIGFSNATRRNLPHIELEFSTYFVTVVTRGRIELSPAARDLVYRHCLFDHRRVVDLHAFVVMPEHLHLLFTPLLDEQGYAIRLAKIMKGLKGASARSVNRLSGVTGSLWQEESWDTYLRDGEAIRAKGEYIVQNPVRRGLVERPEDYPWIWRAWVEGEE